jgi:membrane protein
MAHRRSVEVAPEERTREREDAGDVVSPQPETREPRLADPGPFQLSRRDWIAIPIRGVKRARADGLTTLAKAIAYNAFLSIPSALLVALGVFSLAAGPDAVNTLLDHLRGVVPASAIDLLDQSLTQVTKQGSGGIALVAVGLVLALWSLMGAMGTIMWALNIAYQRDETRGFVKRRLTALVMLFCTVVAVVLVFGLLVLGPLVSSWLGDVTGEATLVTWLWWTLQWPLLVVALLGAFGAMLYLGPNVKLPFRFVTPGSVFAVVSWLVTSGLFSLYTSRFASYNKTWGSLSAVIVMLTWLWLSSLALLAGAEINAETERSRELRRGEAAHRTLQAPTKD